MAAEPDSPPSDGSDAPDLIPGDRDPKPRHDDDVVTDSGLAPRVELPCLDPPRLEPAEVDPPQVDPPRLDDAEAAARPRGDAGR